MNFKSPFLGRGYFCHLICHMVSLRSKSRNLSVLGIFLYESQIAISGRVDLPLDLPEDSEWESISMNLKSPFLGRG